MGLNLIRYDGWCSNKARMLRKKAEMKVSAEPSRQGDAFHGSAALRSQTWALLIKRVYEIDLLTRC